MSGQGGKRRCSDYRHNLKARSAGQLGSAAVVAFRIAADYPNRIPGPSELMERYGMSQPTAYRWVAAMRAGRRHETA
jgi:hypothetical protein